MKKDYLRYYDQSPWLRLGAELQHLELQHLKAQVVDESIAHGMPNSSDEIDNIEGFPRLSDAQQIEVYVEWLEYYRGSILKRESDTKGTTVKIDPIWDNFVRLEPIFTDMTLKQALEHPVDKLTNGTVAVLWFMTHMKRDYPENFDQSPRESFEAKEWKSLPYHTGWPCENMARAFCAFLCLVNSISKNAESIIDGKKAQVKKAEPARYLTDAEVFEAVKIHEELYTETAIQRALTSTQGLESMKLNLDDAPWLRLGAEEQETQAQGVDDSITHGMPNSSDEIDKTEGFPRLSDAQRIEVCTHLGRLANVVYPKHKVSTTDTADKLKIRALALQHNFATRADEEMQRSEAEDLSKLDSGTGLDVEADSAKHRDFLANQGRMNAHNLRAIPFGPECAGILNIDMPDEPMIEPSLATTDRSAFLEQMRPFMEPRYSRDLIFKSHQVDGTATLMLMEQSDIGGSICADEMGLGKTVIALSVVSCAADYADKTGLSWLGSTDKSGRAVFKPTLILVPAASVATWKRDIDTRFKNKIDLRLWYGAPSANTLSTAEKSRTLPTTIRGLRDYIDGLDQYDPRTARVVVISSMSTYMRRIMLDVPGTAAETGDSDEEDDAEEDDRRIRYFEDDLRRGITQDRLDLMKNRAPGMFCRLIIDEAHMVKTKRTKVHQAITSSNCDVHHLLTGTPIGNELSDLEGRLDIIWHPRLAAMSSERQDKDVADYQAAAAYIDETWNTLPVETRFLRNNMEPSVWVLCAETFRRDVGPVGDPNTEQSRNASGNLQGLYPEMRKRHVTTDWQ